MQKIKVLDFQYGINDNEDYIVSAECDVDGKIEFYTMAESFGIPTFLNSEEDIFKKLMDTENDDEEFYDNITNISFNSIEGISLTEYSDFLEDLQNLNTPLAKLLLILITAVKWDESIMEIAKGHDTEDIELEYLDPDDF